MAYDMIEKTTEKYLQNNLIHGENKLSIYSNKFNKLDEIIQYESIKKIVNIITNNSLELSFINLTDINTLIHNKKPHVELKISDNLYIQKSYDLVNFYNNKPTIIEFSYKVTGPNKVVLPDDSLVIITKNPNKYYGIIYKLCYNNLDLIFPLTIRNRVNGDKVITSSGTKKIKDIFINKKIPMETRDKLPVVTNKDNEIIWIPNIHTTKTDGENIFYLIYQEGKNHA